MLPQRSNSRGPRGQSSDRSRGRGGRGRGTAPSSGKSLLHSSRITSKFRVLGGPRVMRDKSNPSVVLQNSVYQGRNFVPSYYFNTQKGNSLIRRKSLMTLPQKTMATSFRTNGTRMLQSANSGDKVSRRHLVVEER